MAPVYRCQSEEVLEAIRGSDPVLRKQRPNAFHELFGYILGNREGVEAYRSIPARLRRGHGRRAPTVKAGSGAIEKNIETRSNRRFKRQGRSWNPIRADRLLQLTVDEQYRQQTKEHIAALASSLRPGPGKEEA